MSASRQEASELRRSASVLPERYKAAARGLLNPVVRLAMALHLTPNTITVIGLGLTVVASVLVATNFLLIGAALLAIGSILDAVDGALARAQGSSTPFGAFFDYQDVNSRSHIGVRYLNSVDGELKQRWQCFQMADGVTDKDWGYGSDIEWARAGVDAMWYGRRYQDGRTDGFTDIAGGEQTVAAPAGGNASSATSTAAHEERTRRGATRMAGKSSALSGGWSNFLMPWGAALRAGAHFVA